VSLETWAAKQSVRVIVLAVIVAAAAVFVTMAMGWRQKAQTATAVVGEQAGKIETTTGTTQDGAVADAHRRDDDASAGTSRAAYRTTMETARREDPAIAARADRPVPARVRDAARARRLARERLNGAEE
jgi:hypothetical protein